MSKEVLLTPYIQFVEPLSTEAVDAHVDNLRLDDIAYYGLLPEGASADARRNHEPIYIEDNSGSYPYSVLVSGNLPKAKTILVKLMSWSDHPGRGFEGLREAMIADPENNLAVIGISLPGAGLNSPPMTPMQKESLKGPDGSFTFIGSQQWEAMTAAIFKELQNSSLSEEEKIAKWHDFDFVLSGSSLGSSQTIGMLKSKPAWARVTALGLAEATDLSELRRAHMLTQLKRHTGFMFNYIRPTGGGNHFKEYTKVNPYNEYPDLGPGHKPFLNAATHPASHIGKTIGVLARGNMAPRLVEAINEQGLHGIQVKMRSGAEDRLSKPLQLRAAAEFIAKVADVDIYSHPGHYHPYLENLANAQAEFRGFTK